jgi:Na+-driven multidrug efflux pump
LPRASRRLDLACLPAVRVLLPSWHWLTPPPVSCALVHQTGWHEVDATTCQEIALLWALAWPLFFQTLANEVQMVVTTSLFGHMGETDLAAANDTTSMIWFILVFVMGAQNALYTMAPQAVGAGSRKQVGIVLQLTLFWTVIVLGPITTVCCYFMGDGLVLLGLTNTTDAVEGAAVQSFSHASAWWMMPYIIVTTVTTWLDAISVVQAPSFISAIFAVGGVGVAWLLMYEGFEISSDLVTGSEGGEGDADGSKFSIGVPALGLNGFAYASAITYTLQFIVLYLYVFKYRGQHKHVWFGWQPKRVFHSGLMCRFIKLSLPMMLQYALNSWTSTIFQLFMSRHSELFAAAYGGAYDGLALLLCSPLLQPSCTTTTCLSGYTHTHDWPCSSV